MIDKIFNEMEKYFLETVEFYKSDFTEYDTQTYGRMADGTHFIWTIRKCGTYIVSIPSTINRQDLEYIKDCREFSECIIEHYLVNYREKKSVRYFHICKNQFIHEIDGKKALEIVRKKNPLENEIQFFNNQIVLHTTE